MSLISFADNGFFGAKKTPKNDEILNQVKKKSHKNNIFSNFSIK
jgi:hypothetical protein